VRSKEAAGAPSQLAICAGVARYAMRATFRNKAGYFFSFLFPLLFVIVFGMLGHPRPAVRLGVAPEMDLSHPVYRALKAAADQPNGPVLLVEGTPSQLQDQLERARIAAIVAPAGGSPTRVTLVSSGKNPEGRAAAESFLKGILGEMNLQAAGVTDPRFGVEDRILPGRPTRFIDFALPGQIGFSMLSLATFGIGYSLGTLRKTLVLKRMLATATRPLTFVVAMGISRALQAVVQTAVLILVGVVLFQFTLIHGWLTFAEMLVLSFLGILSFIGYGILLSNLATDEHVLPVVLNLFTLPQVLLAGVFFPLDGMPVWVQAIGNNLPLAYLNTSLRKAAGEGLGLVELWPYVLGMFAWAAVAYFLAARTFKTEP